MVLIFFAATSSVQPRGTRRRAPLHVDQRGTYRRLPLSSDPFWSCPFLSGQSVAGKQWETRWVVVGSSWPPYWEPEHTLEYALRCWPTFKVVCAIVWEDLGVGAHPIGDVTVTWVRTPFYVTIVAWKKSRLCTVRVLLRSASGCRGLFSTGYSTLSTTSRTGGAPFTLPVARSPTLSRRWRLPCGSWPTASHWIAWTSTSACRARSLERPRGF